MTYDRTAALAFVARETGMRIEQVETLQRAREMFEFMASGARLDDPKLPAWMRGLSAAEISQHRQKHRELLTSRPGAGNTVHVDEADLCAYLSRAVRVTVIVAQSYLRAESAYARLIGCERSWVPGEDAAS